MSRRTHARCGFTLVELLIVIIVLSVLAGIAIPKIMDAGGRSRQAASDANLTLLRRAVQTFNADCGVYPATLDDLARASAPAKGLMKDGSQRAIDPTSWHGPYISAVPVDDVTHQPYFYALSPPNVGTVSGPIVQDVSNGGGVSVGAAVSP